MSLLGDYDDLRKCDEATLYAVDRIQKYIKERTRLSARIANSRHELSLMNRMLQGPAGTREVLAYTQQKEMNAAKKIQCWWRGRLTARQVKQTVEGKRKDRAARRIQEAWRILRSRWRLEEPLKGPFYRGLDEYQRQITCVEDEVRSRRTMKRAFVELETVKDLLHELDKIAAAPNGYSVAQLSRLLNGGAIRKARQDYEQRKALILSSNGSVLGDGGGSLGDLSFLATTEVDAMESCTMTEPSAPEVATPTAEPTAPKDDGVHFAHRAKKLVLDAGAIIKLQRADNFAKELYTTPRIIGEIRDRQARQHLANLPAELKVRSPDTEAMRAVQEFAKKTGDYGFLSINDMEVMALAVMLYKESGCNKELNAAPSMAKFESGGAKGRKAFSWRPEEDKQGQQQEDIPEPLKEEEAEDNTEAPLATQDEEESTAEEVKGEQEEDDDDGGWITATNFRKYARDNHESATKDGEEETISEVSIMSADYSVQNVMMQMGVDVLSFGGFMIRSVKLWALLCTACHKVTRDTSKVFCSKCGNDTVYRVPVYVDSETRDLTVTRSRRWEKMTAKRNKGSIWSIPKNRGGRQTNPLILAEDELLMSGRDREYRRRCNQFEKERQLHNPFASESLYQADPLMGWCTRSTNSRGNALLGDSSSAPKVEAGYGRRNPNRGNFKHTKGKRRRERRSEADLPLLGGYPGAEATSPDGERIEGEDPELGNASFDTLRDAVNRELRDMHREVGKARRLVSKSSNSPKQEEMRIHSSIDKVRYSGVSVRHMLDRMRQLAGDDADKQLEEQRLRDSLGSLLSSVDQLLSSFLVSEERTLQKERVRADEIDEGIRSSSKQQYPSYASTSNTRTPEAADVDSQAQEDPTDALLLSMAELDLQEDIIREREEGIRNIHSDIVAIRGLFQEVAWHVTEQGQVIDNIETNMGQAALRTGQANRELAIASETVRKNTGDSSSMPPQQQQSTAPLPQGWKEYHTPEGKPYYHCAARGITQWERPTEGQPQLSDLLQSDGEKSSDTPDSAASARDDASADMRLNDRPNTTATVNLSGTVQQQQQPQPRTGPIGRGVEQFEIGDSRSGTSNATASRFGPPSFASNTSQSLIGGAVGVLGRFQGVRGIGQYFKVDPETVSSRLRQGVSMGLGSGPNRSLLEHPDLVGPSIILLLSVLAMSIVAMLSHISLSTPIAVFLSGSMMMICGMTGVPLLIVIFQRYFGVSDPNSRYYAPSLGAPVPGPEDSRPLEYAPLVCCYSYSLAPMPLATLASLLLGDFSFLAGAGASIAFLNVHLGPPLANSFGHSRIGSITVIAGTIALYWLIMSLLW
ncbi:Nin1 binding protein [Perkinsus chesapeaki]|uniref:Nin1 binding protein n=1 Tax=Perkinsus chesapeaki TaxID=330153 RepID=A0A7J6MIQ0_PERCH|nr:Nin1 binding protein [Perkinsus chesapeaki]